VGRYFIWLDFRGDKVSASFMQCVNLVPHEARRIISMAFGHVMHAFFGSTPDLPLRY